MKACIYFAPDADRSDRPHRCRQRNHWNRALSWTAPDPSTGLVNYRVLRCGALPSEANCITPRSRVSRHRIYL